MAVLHPPISRGRIISLDVSRAKAARGVRAVLVHADLPAATRMGMLVDDQWLIVKDEFCCNSDVVAIVAAEKAEDARRALRLIDLKVDQLPGVFDVTSALAEGAPAATDSNDFAGNLHTEYRIRSGDAKREFENAALAVEAEVQTYHIEHAFLEPEAGVAWFDMDGTLFIRGSMQGPFIARNKIAAALGMPVARVRVQVPPVGGGFGGKEESGLKIGAWTALLARATGQPVCYQRTRTESMRGNGKREPMLVRHKLASNSQGEFLAMQAEILMDKGAYVSLGGGKSNVSGTLKKALMHSPGPYRFKHVHVDAKAVFTNNVPTCPMRGLGVPQVHLALETQIDDIAHRLGIDPIEIRLRNCLRNGDTTFSGQVLDESVGIEECLTKVAEISKWHSLPRSEGDGRFRVGRGVAAGWYSTGTAANRDAAGAVIYLNEDGTVSAGVNIVEMGQGSATVFTQIVAEELGVESANIYMMPVDTSLAPNAGITAGSRSTTTPGRALLNAASDLKAKLQIVAADLLGVEQADLQVSGGRYFVAEGANQSVSFRDLARAAVPLGIPLYAQGWQAAPAVHVDIETGRGVPFPVFAFGAQVMEVEVDTLTGRTRVTKAYAAHDVGRALNPPAVRGQIEGGMVQGIGQALYEELVFAAGVPVNPNFTDYLLPTSMDAPGYLEVAIVESRYHRGPFGAKGVGEMSLVPTLAAVSNAIFAAVGVRMHEMPATAPRLLAALRRMRQCS